MINFLIFVVLAIIIVNLHSRVGRLERQMQKQKGGVSSGLVRPAVQPNVPEQTSAPQFTPQPAYEGVSGEDIGTKIIDWLKEDWMLKLGAGLLLIGFGWFATYAIVHDWIGPAGQIALGIIAGALIMILGWWRIQKYTHQGGVFLVLGSTTVLLTVFAAREFYDFFDPFSALFIMFLSTAFVALVAVQHNNKVLAVASLALAGIAPFLTNAPTDDEFVLFSYLMIVILGAIWIVVLTGQRELTTAALILVGAYSFLVLGIRSTETDVLLLFMYAFAAIFFVTNTIGILKLKERNEIIPDLVTAVGNGLLLLMWILVAAPEEWQSLIMVAWMFVFVVGAFITYQVTQQKEPFYIYAGVGVLMLAAATAVEFEGPALTLAYTVEVGAIVAVVYALLKDIKMASQASLLIAVPALLSLESLDTYNWRGDVFNSDFFVLLLIGGVMLSMGTYFMNKVRGTSSVFVQRISGGLIVAGSFYWYALLWLALHTGLDSEVAAVFISLVVYTVVGLVSYFYGFMNDNRFIRYYGGALVGFVVARLLLVDVWDMELAGRIVTFFVIGAMLVSTAFVGRMKHKEKTENNVISGDNR